MQPALSEAQRDQLYRPLDPSRVSKLDGKFSYVEAWDDIAFLGYIFGVENWDDDVTYEFVYETERSAGRWDVCYRATSLVTVKDRHNQVLCTKSGVACGSAQNQPSRADAHDLALKDAASSALKRACIKLGDQFGLSLYADGALSVLGTSLVLPNVDIPPCDRDSVDTVGIR